jgi:nickel/cobalt exporter
MNQAVFTPIAVTGFTVAFFHAAIPTHWLPFVLASRAQRWSRSKTLWVTALAGGGHVLFTTLLGLLVVWLGIGLNEKVGHAFPVIAGSALILFGLFYLVRQFRGGGHGHVHLLAGHDHNHQPDHGHAHDHSHDHDHPHEASPLQRETAMLASGVEPKPTSDWVAIGSLFALLTFSPCEGFLPVYLSGIEYGWAGFFVLSVILAGATLAGMVLFTWLTLLGFEKLKLQFVEKYEMGILGGLLCALGLLVILLEH